jgi:hypothetical protein
MDTYREDAPLILELGVAKGEISTISSSSFLKSICRPIFNNQPIKNKLHLGGAQTFQTLHLHDGKLSEFVPMISDIA